MTVLQALDRYYDRMAARGGDLVTPGWSVEPIANIIVLTVEGEITDIVPWLTGKKPRSERVPKWFGRSGTASTPYFLWDNTAYALGISDKDPIKTAKDFSAFRTMHLDNLEGENDAAAVALCKFLCQWDPSKPAIQVANSKLLKQNVAFRLDGDHELLHHKTFAARLVERLRTSIDDTRKSGVTGEAFCLVRGSRLPIARLHNKIKGVTGTASAEVPLVSFEGEAFRSYGKLQGDNAPTSSDAVFRSSSSLNALLDRNGRN